MFVAIGTLGVDTSAIMAGGAVLLVGIGFGLQKLAENFISGLLVLIERPVRRATSSMPAACSAPSRTSACARRA